MWGLKEQSLENSLHQVRPQDLPLYQPKMETTKPYTWKEESVIPTKNPEREEELEQVLLFYGIASFS